MKKRIQKKVKKRKKKKKRITSDKVQKPVREREARLYALWKSIPTILHTMVHKDGGEAKLRDMGIDIKDEELMELIRIRFKSDFSKRFKICLKQLERWDNSEIIQEWVDEFNQKNNVLKHKKDIDYNFTMKTKKEADAARVKLWKELYEGWSEKQKVEHSGTISLAELFEKAEQKKKENG